MAMLVPKLADISILENLQRAQNERMGYGHLAVFNDYGGIDNNQFKDDRYLAKEYWQKKMPQLGQALTRRFNAVTFDPDGRQWDKIQELQNNFNQLQTAIAQENFEEADRLCSLIQKEAYNINPFHNQEET